MTDPLTAIADRLRATRRSAGGEALSEVVVIPALREAIVSNLLAPGERLTEVTLAARLNVSRTPIREAFAQLEREGLVTIVPRAAVFVREVSERDVEETYTVRAALESLAVELATKRRSAMAALRLDEVLAEMGEAAAKNDAVIYTDALDRFYATIMSLSENVTLHATHTTLLGPVRRLRRIAMSQPGRMEASFRQSLKIRDAIVEGNANGPQLMREQLANACHAAKEVLRAGH
ncbi:MAG TPA: GntR family transcriptional regulator [Dyella sp.]|uniref:GntR family transcriptional regulator n=1 Tax=Dyella sp. TaxID=1869338 RepID=UPI002F92BB17